MRRDGGTMAKSLDPLERLLLVRPLCAIVGPNSRGPGVVAPMGRRQRTATERRLHCSMAANNDGPLRGEHGPVLGRPSINSKGVLRANHRPTTVADANLHAIHLSQSSGLQREETSTYLFLEPGEPFSFWGRPALEFGGEQAYC